MVSEIQIYLDNANNCYHPGQSVTGRVECNFTNEKKVRAILVKFKGAGSTSWTETETYYDDFFKEDRTRDVHYTGEEDYLYNQFILTGGTDLTLPPGKHVYPFSYQLPQRIPSSYEDSNGVANVRYSIKAVIDCPWKFDITAVAVFNVISLLDLNTIPRITEPVEISVDKVLCSCWCNNNDPLTFNFTLPTTGYVPGQNVQIGVYVQNLTNASVERVRFKLTQLTEYRTQTPHTKVRSHVEVIADCYDRGIGAHGEKSWTATLLIPSDQSFPNMNDSSLINISYRLKGTLYLPSPHTNLTAFVPLTIGHIPLASGNVDVVLGPPAGGEGLPYIDATAPPSDNVSLAMPNYGIIYNPTIPNGEKSPTAPPTYDDATLLK